MSLSEIFDMFGQSTILTVSGMGFVFSFLLVTVISVNIMSRIIMAIEKHKK